jgi:hypothetical protein
MNSKCDRSCELLALFVLFILSALSHFWFIMILISVGVTIGIVGALLSRVFIYLMTKQFPKPVRRGEFQSGKLPARMLLRILDPRRPVPPAIVQVPTQE